MTFFTHYINTSQVLAFRKFGAHLLPFFKQRFLVFKQYYMYFHILFHLHIFSKNKNNVTKTTLPNGPLIFQNRYQRVSYCLPRRGVRSAVRCGFGSFLAKTITAPYLIFAVTCAVRCGLEFSQNHNCTAPHFCGYMCDTMYKMWFEVSIFFKFWVFLTQPKTNFSFFLGEVLNY